MVPMQYFPVSLSVNAVQNSTKKYLSVISITQLVLSLTESFKNTNVMNRHMLANRLFSVIRFCFICLFDIGSGEEV